METTIKSLVMEFFMNHPKQEFKHAPVVEWVTAQYLQERGKQPQDVRVAVRDLHRDDVLIKVRRGVYKYDPNYDRDGESKDFPNSVKQAIFKRDNYRCVFCGHGREEGIEIAADHIKPRSKDGSNTLENGQTLCYQHNSMKKNYSQTEAGKRFFIKIYESAMKIDDTKMIAFCQLVFDAYDKHDIDGHIKRPEKQPS